MKSRIITVALTALLIMSVVGCPNDTQTGSGTSANNKITSLQTVIDKASDGDTINLSQYADITDYNATVNKELTINGSQTSLNGAALTVDKNTTISGITNASVTASSNLGNGSLKISSSSLSSLNIQGGGINSIVVIDVSVETVTIAKTVANNSTDQYVRFCVDAKTKIGGMNISSSTLIDVTGDVTGNQSKPNADNYNIQFGSDNICVAFNTKMGLTTPDDKARASFGGDTSSDADFFIIVNKGQAIVENFFNQVAEKILGSDKFDPYKEGDAEKFDFSKPIDGDTHFTGKPEDKPITAGGSITIKDYSFIIDTTHDMTCDLSCDTITFTAKNKDEIITGCAWTYELSYGSHDLSGDYWTATSNEWSIGADAAVTDADGGLVSKKTLPEGTYQLYVQATDGYFRASNTYQLKIVRKNEGD